MIQRLPDPHILQTWEWSQLKANFGWKPHYKFWGKEEDPDATALILERSFSFRGLRGILPVLYVPRGPLVKDWGDKSLVLQVLSDLRKMAEIRGAIFVKIDPEVPLGVGIPGGDDAQENPTGEAVTSLLKFTKWIESEDQIQFRNTVLIDLTPSEDEILAKMKQKTRYNVRLAGRRGVTIRTGTAVDFDLLYQMYAETSIRDRFTIREANYYQYLWGRFLDDGQVSGNNFERPICEPLIAEIGGEAAAGMVVFRFSRKAYYMHGMSRAIHRRHMPNYALQWEAMVRAKNAGCEDYDLWGAPEVFSKSDSMWGVYRFKEGLGGKVLRTIGAFDYPNKPRMYRLYTQTLPRLLEALRRRGKMQVERNLQEIDSDD